MHLQWDWRTAATLASSTEESAGRHQCNVPAHFCLWVADSFAFASETTLSIDFTTSPALVSTSSAVAIFAVVSRRTKWRLRWIMDSSHSNSHQIRRTYRWVPRSFYFPIPPLLFLSRAPSRYSSCSLSPIVPSCRMETRRDECKCLLHELLILS